MTDIITLIKDPSLLSEETLPQLRDIVEHYPFYHTARILYVKNLFILHHKAFGTELRKASLLLPDRSALFAIVEQQHYTIECHPDRLGKPGEAIETEADTDRTISLIDTFLQQSCDPGAQAVPSLSDLTNDYASFLLKNETTPPPDPQTGNQPKLKGSDLIDTFIANTQGRQRFEMPELPDFAAATEEAQAAGDTFISPQLTHQDEEIYTENMVNIYISQGRYTQALEILRKICLNNPKKNTNFAAQIKLLETIIGSQR